MDLKNCVRIIILENQIVVTYSYSERTIEKYKFVNANSFINSEQQRFRKYNLEVALYYLTTYIKIIDKG